VRETKTRAACSVPWRGDRTPLGAGTLGCIIVRAIKEVFVYSFFVISSRKIQKLDGFKNEKLKAYFYEFLNFSLSGPSAFISFKN
jgi:hypothetical protein